MLGAVEGAVLVAGGHAVLFWARARYLRSIGLKEEADALEKAQCFVQTR